MVDNAKWIWSGRERTATPEYVMFRKTFDVETIPDRLEISITADSRYILCINSKVISRGPARSDAMTRYYDTVDIASCLKVGKNVITVDAIHYNEDRYQAHNFNVGPTSVCSSSRGGILIFGCEALQTDESYLCQKHPGYQFKKTVIAEYIGYMEQVDGRMFSQKWREVSFDDSQWQHASVIAENGTYTRGGLANIWQIEPRSIPRPYERLQRFCGVTRQQNCNVFENSQGEYQVLVEKQTSAFIELDASVYRTGFVQLEIDDGENARIELLYSESYGYDEAGCFVKKQRDDFQKENSYLQGDTDVYFADHGIQNYTSFHYRSFRYVRIGVETQNNPIKIIVKGFIETGYPLVLTNHFACENTEYNKMWEISLRTLKCCMYETYMDCPYFEQMQYIMDTFLEAKYTYGISMDTRLAEKAIRDFADCQLPNGLIPCNAPSNIIQIIPVFNLFFIFVLYDHYMYFKKTEFIEKYFVTVEKIIQYFTNHIGEDGIVANTDYWQFIDWVKEWNNGVINCEEGQDNLIINMIYVTALKNAAFLAMALNRTDQGNEYLNLANKISQVVNQKGYNAKKGLYSDITNGESYSQHGQMWAVLSDIAQGERAKSIMIRAIMDKTLAQCSLCTGYFLFRALEKVGRYDLTEHLWRSWIDIMKMNVTTWPEDPVNWRSDCHAWGSLPLSEFVSCGLGIQPIQPGYAAIRIAPKMLWLNKCRGVVDTPKGKIKIEWFICGCRFVLKIITEKAIPTLCELPNGTVHEEILQGERVLDCDLPGDIIGISRAI